MNRVYFVRHAKPDFSVHDDLNRPLTEEGLRDSEKLAEYFKDKNITKMYSSPYKRSLDTIKEVSNMFKLNIDIVEDFRERKISNDWIEDFDKFTEMQWNDFNYKLIDGETLSEVQSRNIKELHRILMENNEQEIVIGTHGTALSTIINYYDSNFNHSSFNEIKSIMPWIVCAEFEGVELISINNILNL
ncbi:MAG: histidine phosphatase family protein [Romboutsia sp.]